MLDKPSTLVAPLTACDGRVHETSHTITAAGAGNRDLSNHSISEMRGGHGEIVKTCTCAALFATKSLLLVLADRAATTVLALVAQPFVLADAAAPTFLADRTSLIMSADAASATWLALGFYPLVHTDACPAAFFAAIPLKVMLTDATPTTVFAEVLLSVMGAVPPSTLFLDSSVCLWRSPFWGFPFPFACF